MAQVKVGSDNCFDDSPYVRAKDLPRLIRAGILLVKLESESDTRSEQVIEFGHGVKIIFHDTQPKPSKKSQPEKSELSKMLEEIITDLILQIKILEQIKAAL